MKRTLIYVCLLFSAFSAWGRNDNLGKETKEIMKRVADWQIDHPNSGAVKDELDWTRAPLYMGMVDWAEIAEKKTATKLIMTGCSG